MPLHVCYALTTNGQSCYGPLAYISASGVRRFHPDARITLLTDTESHLALEQSERRLLELVDRVVVADVQEPDLRTRSRILKTTTRLRVEGDYLLLDVDTLPLRPFESVMKNVSLLAATSDRNAMHPYPHFPEWHLPLFKELGWPCPLKRYFSSGLLVVRDKPPVHAFFEEWHRRWQQGVAAGVPIDQPAFNSALDATGLEITELPLAYHAVIDASPKFARGAYILHIEPRNGRPPEETILGYLFTQLAETGRIDWEAVDKCRQQGHPWGPPYEAWRMRQSGNYLRAAVLKGCKIGRSLAGLVRHQQKKQGNAMEETSMAAAGANEETGVHATENQLDVEPQTPRRDAGSPVFIVGVHRRCGSNFLAGVLRLCPELEGPAPLSEDYVLEYSPLLTQYVEQTAAEQYRKRFEDDHRYRQCKAAMLRRLGDGILAFLGSYIQPGKRLLTKTPDAFHLENYFRLFPEATLLILVRDGRDVVESSHRSWPSESYAHWMKAWARGAREILDFTTGPGQAWAAHWKLLRYEDLLGDRRVLEEVLDFIAVDRDAFPWDRLDALPVRGSSVHRGGRRELNWDPVQKPKDFKPVGRWQSWGRWRRWQFKRLAGRELTALGYATDNSW